MPDPKSYEEFAGLLRLHTSQVLAYINAVIPQSFLDAILEVIAQSIEQVLADVMARCVAEGIEQKIRPLTQEIALLRIAIEHEWECSTRRQRENTQ